MARALRLLFLLAVLLANGGCATNPVSGGADFVLMTESQEIALGERTAAQIARQYARYDHPALQAYVTRIGQRLAAVSHRPTLRWQFTVLDTPEVNAFALPGGRVYVTRGLLAYLNSEAELAAVLGHEIGHVTARHAVNQVSKTAAFGLGLEVLSARVPELRSAGTQQSIQLLGDALLKGYGREHELQSDRLGAEYLARAGYDPEAMIAVIAVLKNQEEYEKRQAAAEGRAARVYHGVFATHPSNDQRLREVVGEARRFRTAGASAIGQDEYLRQIRGLRYGESARHGLIRGQQYLNRELDLSIVFPSGWRLQLSESVLLAVNTRRDSVIQAERPPRAVGTHTPASYLRALLARDTFESEKTYTLPGGLAAHEAVTRLRTPFGVQNARVVTVFHRGRPLVFLAAAADPAAEARLGGELSAVLHRLRTLTAQERRLAGDRQLILVTAGPGTTFRELARRHPALSEDQLRLLNGRYPDGQPRPGEQLKVVE
jgi:predicted Zn-dependent protease